MATNSRSLQSGKYETGSRELRQMRKSNLFKRTIMNKQNKCFDHMGTPSNFEDYLNHYYSMCDAGEFMTANDHQFASYLIEMTRDEIFRIIKDIENKPSGEDA